MFDDNSGRGPFWDIAAFSALGYGIGVPLLKNASDFKSSLKDNIGTYKNVFSEPSTFNLARHVSKPSDININPYIAGFLRQKVTPDIIKQDIFRGAYQAAMSGRGASAEDIKAALSPVLSATNARSAIDFATQKVEALGGDISVLQKSIADRAEEGTFRYKDSLLSSMMMERATASPFENVKKMATETTLFDLKKADPFAHQQAMKFEELFSNKEGRNLSYYNVKDIVAGKEVTTPMMRMNIGRESLDVPLSRNAPFVYSGENFTTRYVPRKTYTAEGRILSDAENIYERMKRIPDLNEEAVLNIKGSISPQAKNMLDDAKATRIPTIPESVMPAGGRARARMILNEAVSFSDINEEDIVGMFNKGFTPYTAPRTAAKGTLMTKDVVSDVFGPFGAFASPEKRPLQFIRPEWSVTQPAKDLAVNKQIKGKFGNRSRLEPFVRGPGYQKYMYGKYDVASSQAYSIPQLRTFYAKTKGDFFVAEDLNKQLALEESVVSQKAKGMLRYEKINPIDIDISEINKDILSYLEEEKTIGKVIVPNEPITSSFLGLEKATGREVFRKGGMDSIAGMELLDKSTARIYMKEEVSLEENKYLKMFSEESKHVVALERKGQLQALYGQAVSGSPVSKRTLVDLGVEQIMGDKIVGRNKMALLNQQVEAMADIINLKARRNTLSVRGRQYASEFFEDPIKYLKINGMINQENLSKSFEDIEKTLVSFARRKFRFGNDELALTFGLMSEDIATKIGIEDIVQSSPGVLGMSKMYMGDVLSTGGGSGGLGTLEQSGFRLLMTKGKEGNMVASDFADRMVDKQSVAIQESNLMASSVLGQEIKRKGVTDMLQDIADEDLIQKKGRFVGLGRKVKSLGGASQIYIPGSETTSLVSPFRTKSGEIMENDLVRSLRNFQESLSIGDETKIEEAATKLRENAFLASERQSSARGNILGSRFLGATRREFFGDDIARISPKDARNMYKELIDRTTDKEKRDFLMQEKERLLNKQGEIGYGAVWRHPITGAESIQYSKFTVDPRIEPGTIGIPAKPGILAIEDGEKAIKQTIEASLAAGTKTDFDADRLAIGIISDKGLLERVKAQVDGSLSEDYNKYLFRHNVLKNELSIRRQQDATSELSRKTMLAAGHRKNTVAQTTTGRMNLAIQKIKMGIQSTSPDKYRPLADVLFHVEEAAIGGKHGALGQKIMEDVVKSVETGGKKGIDTMTGVLEAMFGQQRTVSGSVAVNGQTIDSSFEIAPKQWAESMITSSDMVKKETAAAIASSQIGKAGGRNVEGMELKEMQKIYNLRRQAQVDASQRLIESKAGTIISDKGITAVQKGNRAIKTIESIISKNKRTIGIGLGAAAAIMAFAPSLSGTVESERPSAGETFTPDMIGSQNVGVMPMQQAGMGESPKVYDISGIEQTKRANIRMKMEDYEGSGRDIQNDIANLSQYGDVRVRTTDDRSIKDHFSLARQIEDRL